MKSWFKKYYGWVIFGALVLVTSLFRLINFPGVPYGLHQDEINAGYEAWSLLNFGTDRWGNTWPVYFPSWGSGQNVLYSYLLIPFIAVFGPTDLAVRLLMVILGILVPVLIFFIAKYWYNLNVALVAMFVSSIFPELIRGSRWAVESNLVPFMIALSLLAVTIALKDKKQRWYLIVPALIPLALTAYTYIVITVPILIFGVLLLIWKRKLFWANKTKWFISAFVFLVTLSPILLYLAKITVFKNNPYSFENLLPFSLPILDESRYDQITGDNGLGEIILNNFLQLFSGYYQGQIGSGAEVALPLFIFVIIGLILPYLKISKTWFKTNVINLFCIASLSLAFFVPLSNIRGNLLIVPFILISTNLIYVVLGFIRKRMRKVVTVALVAFYVGYVGVWFTGYLSETNWEFSHDFKEAYIAVTTDNTNDTPVLIEDSNRLDLTYMRVMWYELLTPQEIAKNREPKEKLENFVFQGSLINTDEAYYELIRVGFNQPCDNNSVIYQGDTWVGYKCEPND